MRSQNTLVEPSKMREKFQMVSLNELKIDAFKTVIILCLSHFRPILFDVAL